MPNVSDRVVATFKIRRRQFLDLQGLPVAALPPYAEDADFARKLYRGMLLARAFDAKCVNLQRTGRLGTYATALGQEAVPIGIASAMHRDDVFAPSYREGSAQIWRGVRIDELLIYWGGDERGHCYADPAVAEDLPVCITVGNHALHAAGVATALQIKGEKRAALCVFGDGATSKGDIYEAFNVAGVWSLPVVFVITNNQWATSTPLKNQTAAQTLAQKGLAGGIEVLQVDGNDVIAVHDAVSQALERARDGGGATLVECLTYRLNDHNTADDSTRYRDPEEVKQHWARCPLKRMRGFLESKGWWDDGQEAAAKAEIDGELEAAVASYLATESDSVSAMFDYVFEALPSAYANQRNDAIKHEHA